MKVSIIQYNAGNISSVKFALTRLGVNCNITDDIDTIQSSDFVIFPGVGEASSAMKYLKEKKLDKVIKELKQPVLGICLGMQLLCRFSEEGNTNCLGIIPVEVKKFNISLKIPQIGWNTIYQLNDKVFTKIPENSYVYYVHSYYVPINDFTIAKTNYGIEYSAAIKMNNFYGVQFHPEKSATIGDSFLKNFFKLI